MQKWCLGCNFIVANTQLSLFYLEIFVARLLRGGVLQNNNTDNQRVTYRNNPTKYNNALKTVYSPMPFNQAILDRKSWGRIFESGVGAYLVSQAFVHRFDVFYWRERNDEVDFILRKKNSLVAIEVKGNAEKRTEGLDKFREIFKPTSSFIVGDGGIKVEEFMSMDLMKLF